MIVTIPQLLSTTQLAWVKSNTQTPEDEPLARRLGGIIQSELDRNQFHRGRAAPLKVLPPLFNRYSVGQAYGAHIDGAVQPLAGSHHQVRTDLSATIFLSDSAHYDGGELMIGAAGGQRTVKLPAGDMVLYSGGTVHHLRPITRGVRQAAFFWVQSMVRDDARREILFDLDGTIQRLGHAGADHDACVRLVGIYHNLLRQWADT